MNRWTEKFAFDGSENYEHMTKFLFSNEERAFGEGPEHDLWVRRANGRKPESALTELLKNMDIRFVAVEGRPVVIDFHAMKRADRRALLSDVGEFVKGQLTPTILGAILQSKVAWKNRRLTPLGDGQITATAVVQQGCDLVPIFESGRFFLNVRSFLAKGDTERRNYFFVGTKVLYVDTDCSHGQARGVLIIKCSL